MQSTGQASTQAVSFTPIHGSAITYAMTRSFLCSSLCRYPHADGRRALALVRGPTSLDGQFVHVSKPELHTQVLHLRNFFCQHSTNSQSHLRVCPKRRKEAFPRHDGKDALADRNGSQAVALAPQNGRDPQDRTSTCNPAKGRFGSIRRQCNFSVQDKHHFFG